jgi:hypothetical protein
MVEFAEKQQQLLLQASSQSSYYNPHFKMPQNKYKTNKHWNKNNDEVYKKINAKQA